MLSPQEVVSEGSDVVVYIDGRRKWIVRVVRGGVFGSDRGYIKYDNVIGQTLGSEIKLSTGFSAYLLKPLLIDYLEKGFRRQTQVLYPKDMGLMLILLGIGPGSKVLESGIGSGFMTSVIANVVRPSGHVYAYEVREDFAKIAMENLARLGLDKYVTVKIRDIREGVDERNLDAAVIDMPNPWEALDPIHSALKPSAPITFFLPTVSQVERLLNAIQEHGGFTDLRCFEVLLREFHLVPGAIRPRTQMIGHTGYIFFARKVIMR